MLKTLQVNPEKDLEITMFICRRCHQSVPVGMGVDAIVHDKGCPAGNDAVSNPEDNQSIGTLATQVDELFNSHLLAEDKVARDMFEQRVNDYTNSILSQQAEKQGESNENKNFR